MEDNMFKWDNKYSLGVETIDVQHQALFKVGEKLAKLVTSKRKSDNFSDIMLAISELLSYTNEHFDSEEKYMRSIHYPKLEEHKIQHKKMIDYISKIDIGSIHLTQHKTLESLVDFLSNWIGNHIMETDQQLAEYVRQMK